MFPFLFCDDELVSVDVAEVCEIFLTESSENGRSVGAKMMGPLTRRSKLTVALKKVLADMKLNASGGELAGTVQTFTLVVMHAYLETRTGGGLCQRIIS